VSQTFSEETKQSTLRTVAKVGVNVNKAKCWPVSGCLAERIPSILDAVFVSLNVARKSESTAIRAQSSNL
jgi:hypothetical protein